MSRIESLTGWQQFLLVLFRFAVGWHLFYQGYGKLQTPNWSAKGYLQGATGPLSALFHRMGESATLLRLADLATIWGLMAFGLLLMIGLFTRASAVGGILLLVLFYTAMPPLPTHGFAVRTPDGSELYVNKVLIELLALALTVAFDTGRISGLDMLLGRRRARRAPEIAVVEESNGYDRKVTL